MEMKRKKGTKRGPRRDRQQGRSLRAELCVCVGGGRGDKVSGKKKKIKGAGDSKMTKSRRFNIQLQIVGVAITKLHPSEPSVESGVHMENLGDLKFSPYKGIMWYREQGGDEGRPPE